MLTIIFLGTYPPRRCGIATFMADLRSGLISIAPELNCCMIAMSDKAGCSYPPEVVYEIRQRELHDYTRAARWINAANPGVLCVQHEFGIFGGAAGKHLLALLDSVACPVVSILHTVLENPDSDQRSVFDQLLNCSDRVIVMAERGRQILQRVWNADASKIHLIPHGVPEREVEEDGIAKSRLGFEGRDLLLTFGLISPDKGIETMIRAMPTILAARPKAIYLVVGVTHPSLVALQAERYRESLFALSIELGVTSSVSFVNEYLDTPRLLDIVQAADVCIMPYRNPSQVTSGTLAYSVGLGKAIISTPFWHASEVLAGGKGVLAPFEDHDAIASATIEILSDVTRRRLLQQRTYASSRELTWGRLAQRYLDLLLGCTTRPRTSPLSPLISPTI